MPTIGEICRGEQIGKIASRNYIWVECAECGTERWVNAVRGLPVRDVCAWCASNARRTQFLVLPDKTTLQRLHWIETQSLKQIARTYGVGVGTVHYKMRSLGIPTRCLSDAMTIYGMNHCGEQNHNWKGGRTQNGPDGYVYIMAHDHPRASKQGYIGEHILVWRGTMVLCPKAGRSII